MQGAQGIQKANSTHNLSTSVVWVDYGPMRMSIQVLEHGKPLLTLAEEGGRLAIKLLEDLAKFLPVLKRRSEELNIEDRLPDIVRRMIEATKKMEEPDLTPLAAVAGTTSEMVADFIFSKGGTKVIVENGGDIALRLREGELASVGVKTAIDSKQPGYRISIDSTMGIGGVATSGLGGRSFTKGIASAVTVLAEKASMADAAATVIGNFTNIDDPKITRTLAEEIYPDTDIAGQWVTIKVGELGQEKIEQALNNGLSKAYSICQNELIGGALISVQGQTVWTDSLESLLMKL